MPYSVVGSQVREMFGSIAERYDAANSALSFGIHHFWRRALVGLLPASTDGLVLDLCTGTGDLIPILSKRFGQVVGGDFCFPMLPLAKKKASGLWSENGHRLFQGDALQLPFAENSFDVVSVAFGVRNFENLAKGLTEIQRVLKPGGHALILEFGQPRGLIWGNCFRFYSSYVMPVLGGFITGNKEAYTYLPETSKKFPCGKEFEEIMRGAGLAPQRTRALSGGIAYAYSAEKSRDL